ncbi:MAG: MiaB/RimO family radical SAM methylthiotransferase [Nanoarchaeota archaeon]|nr:MiaB/RimO family radical SAM methylthiotransferase [Nanoarchaeota archaeon]
MTSFYIETYGDSPYSSDAEQMAGLLQQAKFEPKEKMEEADIVILNTHKVKRSAVDSFVTKLNDIKKEYPYKIIIVAGCIPQVESEQFKNYTIIGMRQFHHIVEAVEETLHNNIVKMLDIDEMPPLDLPKIRKNPFLEIIPLTRESFHTASAGSKIKSIPRSIDSYPRTDIINAATKAVKEGVKEIWLTSQDSASYGVDIDTNLPTLLKELIQIQGNFKIRLDKCNPASLKKIKDDFFPLFSHEKMFKYIHLPIQSGSNAMLKEMSCGSTKEECTALVQELWRIEPHLTLMTDIKVGYPTETEDDFWETLNLVRFLNPDMVNISRFTAKPKTPAAFLPSLPEEEIQRRIAVLTEIYLNVSKLRNERWKDWEGNIVIDEKGLQSKEWVGHNEYYKAVIVEGEYKMGDMVKVRIIKTGRMELRGEKIN